MEELSHAAKSGKFETCSRNRPCDHRVRMLVLVLIAWLPAPPAQAYLDPGTGSIIVQGLIAGIAAIVAGASLYWQRLKAMFSRRQQDKPAESSTEVGDQDPP